MADLKPIGSEKLPLDQKIQRIMEIANYGVAPKVDTHKTASLEYNVTAADGNKYGIIRENNKYLVLKEGDNGYTYLDGMKNNSRYSFSSYSEAFKKLNLLMKPINETFNNGKQFNLIGEQEEAGKKYVLKQPESEVEDEEESFDFSDDTMTDEGGDDEEVSFDDMDMSMGDDDEGGEEIEGSMDIEVTDDEDATKSVQKLTGKLGQKLRDLPETDMDADIIKYVLNSVISAVNLEKLSEEDKEEIVEKFEDEDIEYTEEGEFDVELGGEEELDLGDEDFDFEDEELDLETELSENWGTLGKMAVGAAATAFGERAADKYLPEEEDETLNEMFEGEHKPLNDVLGMAMDNPELAKKFIDAVLGCANLQQLQDLMEVITWVNAKPDYCGKVMNIVQDERCVLDLTEYLTSDNFKGMACLLRKVGSDVFTNVIDKGMDTITGMFDLDEENTITPPNNPELSDEAAEAVANVFDMFESESKVGKTLTSYFDYTKSEKRKIRESKERKSFDLHLAKNELLESVLKKAKKNKVIKNSYSTYEQERTTKKFLNENRGVKFLGKNKKGSLIFKEKNNLVEINTRGRIS